MSFGFSVGDFIATTLLMKKIVTALSSSSVAEYCELQLELEGLERALNAIEHLQPAAGEELTVNGLKVAALSCRYTLQEFHKKLEKYESLEGIQKSKARDIGKLWTRKLQWGLTMQDEVRNLRAYLMAHVGFLNMRLATLNLAASLTTTRQSRESAKLLEDEIVESRQRASETTLALQAQSSQLTQTSTSLETIVQLISGGVVAPLKAISTLVQNVWSTNLLIINLLVAQKASVASIDTRHTWFQAPVRFEDALGRRLPVPSEYNHGKLYAIIQDHFKGSPGHDKVLAGEYELFSATDTCCVFEHDECQMLMPGMSITMAFVIGMYKVTRLSACPRPGCKGRSLSKHEAGGNVCMKCDTWVDLSHQPLPRPFRYPKLEDGYRQIRSDRQKFKYVRVVPNDWPLFLPSTESQASPTTVHGSTQPANVESRMSREEKETIFRTICNEMTLSPDGLGELLRTHPNSDLLSLGMDSMARVSILAQLWKLPSLRTRISDNEEEFWSWLPGFILRDILNNT